LTTALSNDSDTSITPRMAAMPTADSAPATPLWA